MDKYQGPTVAITLLLIVGAALSETFLHVTWSPGLMALLGIPLMAVFADKAAARIKKNSEARTAEELAAATPDGKGGVKDGDA